MSGLSDFSRAASKLMLLSWTELSRSEVVTNIFCFLVGFSPHFSVSSLQYVNKAATCMRGALKEPAKTKAMAQEAFQYNAASWEGGVMGAKSPVTSLGAAGK